MQGYYIFVEMSIMDVHLCTKKLQIALDSKKAAAGGELEFK